MGARAAVVRRRQRGGRGRPAAKYFPRLPRSQPRGKGGVIGVDRRAAPRLASEGGAVVRRARLGRRRPLEGRHEERVLSLLGREGWKCRGISSFDVGRELIIVTEFSSESLQKTLTDCAAMPAHEGDATRTIPPPSSRDNARA